MLPTVPELASVAVSRSAPAGADAFGVAVKPSGAVPRQVGLSRARLATLGFEAKPGQTLVVPGKEGAVVVAVGLAEQPTPTELRDAAAAVVRAVPKAAHVAVNLLDAASGTAAELSVAAQAVAEGALLAGYKYAGIRSTPAPAALERVTLVAGQKAGAAAPAGIARATATAAAAALARELANTPASHLTARGVAELAVALAPSRGLKAEVFDADKLRELGCGGLLGVNAGSTEPPRLVKLSYVPRGSRKGAHIALVGKGVTYDSGGLSLKPTNALSALMKLDMSGSAAVLAAMTALAELKCPNRVTAWLMLTDNMPSGSALKLGDVLTMRNGKTVEVLNTDAEGRLVLADGLVAASELRPDAIIDVATLTGAARNAFGFRTVPVMGDAELTERVVASAARVGEDFWRVPLGPEWRPQLKSDVADLANVKMGSAVGGMFIAGAFLQDFVGKVSADDDAPRIPWTHLDIAGPANNEGGAYGYTSAGTTGVAVRALVALAADLASGE
ncbi:MAG TPA: leucyl aminopeptidase [Ilumatobacter sp.]|nr:leucyl aminopeptidase [Ilumatobacter sp.]